MDFLGFGMVLRKKAYGVRVNLCKMYVMLHFQLPEEYVQPWKHVP